MSKRQSLWGLVVLAVACGAAWGQDNSAQQPADAAPPQSNPQQPAPAYGPANEAPSVSDNPPISGLDMPNLQPHAAPLSYLQAGAHVSESVDSNIENSLGGSSANSLTRAEGSLELQRLWSHYDLSLDYLGGVGYYNAKGIGFKQVQELGFYQKTTWKRGEFGVRDAFSYQPEGTFGSSYGAVGATGAGLGEVSAFFGGSVLGALGVVPRIMNLSLADAVETLTPKSSVTATAGYGFVHFLQNEPGTEIPFIGSSQVTGELGYNRILGPHDQGAIVYGYEGFQFSTGVTFHANIIQLMWGHRISGRMDFLVSAGPQFLEVNDLLPTSKIRINDLRVSAAGRALLRYQFPRASLEASYEHFLTSGAGLFAGAESDIARLSVSRPLGRVWTGFSDVGYSRNSRVTPCTTLNCPGVSANVYQYGFVGVGVHRMFGRSFHAFASYQFNELYFDSSYCGSAGPCNRISPRQVGTIGLDWTPRPIRLD